MSVPQLIRQTLLLVGGIAMIAITSGRLMLIMLAAVPAVTVLAVVFGRKIRVNSRETQDKLAETGIIVEETLQGIFNVKAFVNESFEIGRYGRSMAAYLKAALRGAVLRGAFYFFHNIFSLFGTIVLVLWSGSHVVTKRNHQHWRHDALCALHHVCGGRDGAVRGPLQPGFKKRSAPRIGCGNYCGNSRKFVVDTSGAAPVEATPRHALRGEVEFRDRPFSLSIAS